ncbi:KIF-binding protein [Camponotus japonicus]
MLDFIRGVLEHRIEQIRNSETTKTKETNTSKNDDVLIGSEEYLKILNSSFELKFLYEKFYMNNKIPKRIKEMISEGKFEMNNLFKNYVINSMEIQLDDILALAIAYFNLGRIYICKEINLDAAKYHLTRCIKLLKGKELHYKVILTAIQARVDLNIVYIKLQQLEKCYPLLDEALELYLNYTKDENEYPDPFNIDALYHTKDEIINSKILLTKCHMLTLEYMSELYYHQPINMHKFVIYVHNLLNEQLKIMENSTEKDMFIYWAEASTDLSAYFLYYDRFIEAKIHLAAADYMTTMYYVSILIDQDYSEACESIGQYKLTRTFITKLWAMYGIMLLRSSRERLILCKSNKSCEANNVESESHPKSEEELMKPLTFVDLEKDLENIGNYYITDTYVSNLKDVKIIFANVFTWLNVVYTFCIKGNQYFLGNQFMSPVQTILYISKAYTYYAYFEGNKSKQIKVIKQQTEMLDIYISALFSKYYTELGHDYYKELYFEVAITYTTLLNMTSELNEIEKIIDEMEIKQLVENIIHNFNLFLNNV